MFRLKNPAINGVVLPGKEVIICIARLDSPLKELVCGELAVRDELFSGSLNR